MSTSTEEKIVYLIDLFLNSLPGSTYEHPIAGPSSSVYLEDTPESNLEDTPESNSEDTPESNLEDTPEYQQKLIRNRMRNMLKFGYDVGKTHYSSLRPERRSNDFRVYPEENTMLTKEMPTSDSQNLRQPKRKMNAKSLSKLSKQKNLNRNLPDKSSAKSSTSSGKQKDQFVNKRKKSISSTESPVKKARKISRNVSHVAKYKITKPAKVVKLKQSKSQLFTKSKSLMKVRNLFLSESISTSDQQKIPPKSTRVSAGSGKKVKLQSSKKLLLVAEKNASSKNTGSKFKKNTEKIRQEKPISSMQSAQTSAMKPCLRSRLNESSKLQNKIKQSKKKPAKDSSIQKSEAKMKNISLGSSKSKHIKKRKTESDDSCSIPSRNISCAAKQKITKPTKVAQLKPPRSQLFTKSKSLIKDGNLFSSESTPTSDQQKISLKPTRVSVRSGKKAELQSSKKSLLLAEKNASSKNTGSKFKNNTEKIRQEKPISSMQSAQTSAMKPCLRSRLNVSAELQKKRKSEKDSSNQKAEGMVKIISSQSSKSKCIKKGKEESDDPSGSFVTRQRRSVSKNIK